MPNTAVDITKSIQGMNTFFDAYNSPDEITDREHLRTLNNLIVNQSITVDMKCKDALGNPLYCKIPMPTGRTGLNPASRPKGRYNVVHNIQGIHYELLAHCVTKAWERLVKAEEKHTAEHVAAHPKLWQWNTSTHDVSHLCHKGEQGCNNPACTVIELSEGNKARSYLSCFLWSECCCGTKIWNCPHKETLGHYCTAVRYATSCSVCKPDDYPQPLKRKATLPLPSSPDSSYMQSPPAKTSRQKKRRQDKHDQDHMLSPSFYKDASASSDSSDNASA